MMQTRKWAALSMLTVAGGLAACADQSVLTAPAAIADAPTLGVNAAGEGELIICKAGNASGTFTFDYSFVTLVGTVDLPGGTVSVDAGSCVTVVSQPGNGRWRATITEQAPPANWALTSITIVPSLVDAGNPSVDVPNRTASANISNDLGETFTFTNTFTPPPTGEIGDFVWDDLNGNGIQDSGEPGIAGVTVTLSGAASGTTTTDANGYYNFTGLGAGSYTVTVATPAGYTASPSNQGGDATKDSNGSPASVTLATDSSIDMTIDFGFTKGTGVIGDFVWNDLNGNGIQDSGEPGIAGVTVTLSGAASGSTTTDANGYYSFTGLSAGSYTVTVATPAGYNATLSNQGGDPTKDSNGSPASVTLAANNSVDLTIDFGYVKLQGPACTLTQGYWKTHPEDWDNGEKYVKTTDLFYNSGVSYLNLLWTSPSGGNAYVQLAHQFIAASLNVNGTSGSGVASVDAALAGAAAYFASAPAGIPTPSGSLRTQLLAWATTLDNYNNGLIGPGHCN
jgi:SdrD B-like domain